MNQNNSGDKITPNQHLQANLGFLLTPAISADASGNAKISSESARFIPLNAFKAKLKIYYSYIAKAK